MILYDAGKYLIIEGANAIHGPFGSSLTWAGVTQVVRAAQVNDANDTGLLEVDTDLFNVLPDADGSNDAEEVTGATFTGFFIVMDSVSYYVYEDPSDPTVMYVPYNGIALDSYTGTVASGYNADASIDENVLCFVAGTEILMAEGEYVAVETLSVGQQLTTSSGASRKIKFIFKDRVRNLGIYFDKSAIMPVRVLQGALGADSPSCDLLLSPSHALLIDGNLVEAHALINGSSIYQETSWEGELTYYHIEMEDHDIIYAENTAIETFIDNASRVTFDNYDEYKELYGEEQDMLELEYPRAKSSRQLPRALKQKLLDRAAILYPELIAKKAA